MVFKYFFISENRFPIYVKNKAKAIEYCKKKFIPVKEYFNTPVQPLNSEEYKLVNYNNNLCIILSTFF